MLEVELSYNMALPASLDLFPELTAIYIIISLGQKFTENTS